MDSISVTQTLRPVRYAFLISNDEMESALHAVSLNTVIWGGIYNPIVPIDPLDQCLEILRAFDPDILVNLTKGDLPKVFSDSYSKRILTAAELYNAPNPDLQQRIVRMGLGIGHVLFDFHEKELYRGARSTEVAIV